MTFSPLQDQIRQFAIDRDWEQFHSPRNLLLALVGEVGELAAEAQWLPDSALVPAGRDPQTTAKLNEEIADVGIYLLRLADVLSIDLEAAIRDKLDVNAAKYPVALAHGRADKYTELGDA